MNTLGKVNSADKNGGYHVDKFTSANNSIAFNVVDDGFGNKTLDLSASVGPFSYYMVLLTQTTTGAPVAVELANTLGATVTWTRSNTGRYLGTSNLAIFDAVKTGCLIQASATSSSATENNIHRVSTTVLEVDTFNASKALADSILSGTLVIVYLIGTPPNTPPPSTVTYVQTAVNYSVNPSNKIIGVDTTAGAVTITINPATYPVGQECIVKDEGGNGSANNILFSGAFEDGTVPVIDADYGILKFYSNGVDTLYITDPN